MFSSESGLSGVGLSEGETDGAAGSVESLGRCSISGVGVVMAGGITTGAGSWYHSLVGISISFERGVEGSIPLGVGEVVVDVIEVDAAGEEGTVGVVIGVCETAGDVLSAGVLSLPVDIAKPIAPGIMRASEVGRRPRRIRGL